MPQPRPQEYLRSIQGDEQAWRALFDRFEAKLQRPEVQTELKNIVSRLEQELRKALRENPQRGVQLMVGGKSRFLTEIFLKQVTQTLPSDDPVAQLVSQRARLNQNQNKNAYEVSDTLDSARETPILDTVLTHPPQERPLMLFVDDHSQYFVKAKKMRERFEELGLELEFLVLCSTQPVPPDAPHAVSLSLHEDINDILAGLSRRLSELVDERIEMNPFEMQHYGLDPDNLPDTVVQARKQYFQTLRRAQSITTTIREVLQA